MTGGMLITFREGLEAFLVVGIILSYLSRAGFHKQKKWVYAGVALALVSAFIMALAFQVVFSGFSGASAEVYVKIGVMAVAVAVLTYVLVWMARNSRSIKSSVEAGIENAMSAGNVFALVAMAYLAILREGFETVLFLGAIYGGGMGMEVFYGGMAGLALALAVTATVFRGMRMFELRTFFKVTGALVLLISAGLLMNMTGMMQDVGLLPVVKKAVFDLSWLMDDSSEAGIFFKALFGYTSAPSLLQIVVYPLYITSVYALVFRDWGAVKKNELAHA